MKVKNNSTRLHHVGDVSIIPGETAEVSDAYAGALSPELEVVERPKAAAPVGAGKAAANTSAKAAAAATPAPAPSAPVAPWTAAAQAGGEE